MPKGMTPKKRKLKTTVSLARSLKPSGRLNVDDVEKAKDLRKKMSLSGIKDAKKLGKGIASIGSMMSQGMSASAAKNLMKKNAKPIARRTKPASVISRRRARVKR